MELGVYEFADVTIGGLELMSHCQECEIVIDGDLGVVFINESEVE